MNRISSRAAVGSLLVLGVLIGAVAFADEFDDFAEDLNQAWVQTNNVQMLNLIGARLSADTNDVMALSARMYYYVFADCNLTNARQTADQLYAVVQQESDADANAFCLEMKNEVYAISISESGPYGQAEIEQIHAGLSAFPSIRKCLWLSKKIAGE
ncbi:MAG: hypothetical protein M5U15_12545 [Kiritimatiellae bacterium]|nr:hypothetical protein [Kiritimatiellia bacterium]